MNKPTPSNEHQAKSARNKLLNLKASVKSMFTRQAMTIEDWESLESKKTNLKSVEPKYVGFKRIQ